MSDDFNELQKRLQDRLSEHGMISSSGEIAVNDDPSMFEDVSKYSSVTINGVEFKRFLNMLDYNDTPQQVYITPNDLKKINARMEFIDRLMSKKARKANRNR